MKIYDISLPLSQELVTWPGDPPLNLSKAFSIAAGDACNVTKLEMGVHTGTHIDAPYHFVQAGVTTESIPIQTLMGKCLVIEVTTQSDIQVADFEGYELQKHKRVLFKTTNSALWESGTKKFDKNFIALSLEAANYLVQAGVVLVGIDYLSIESFGACTHDVHNTLLRNSVTILEGLNLFEVDEGIYDLVCLPLKLIACDGAPARAILKEINYPGRQS